jgi:hypothetical protein
MENDSRFHRNLGRLPSGQGPKNSARRVAVTHIGLSPNVDVLPVGECDTINGNFQVRRPSQSATLSGIHNPALQSSAAFGDHPAIDYQRLRQRGEEAIARLVARRRKSCADADRQHSSRGERYGVWNAPFRDRSGKRDIL